MDGRPEGTPDGGWAQPSSADSQYKIFRRYPCAGTPVAATLLERLPSGEPAVLELAGRLLSAPEDQGGLRRRLAMRQCEDIIQQLGGPEAAHAWLVWIGLAREQDDAEVVTLVREIANFLICQGHRDIWKLLYLKLRESSTAAIGDRLMQAFCVGGYQEADELRFLWGNDWEATLAAAEGSLAADAKRRGHTSGAYQCAGNGGAQDGALGGPAPNGR